MSIEIYIQKWKEAYAKGLLLTDLRRIKRNNPEYLEEAIKSAAQVNIFDTVLFVYYYCNSGKYNNIFNMLWEEALNENNRRFSQLENLVEEEKVKLDELKKALVLINQDEEWKKNDNKYSKKVTKDLLKIDYKADLYNRRRQFMEKFAESWQALVLLWGSTGNEQSKNKLVEICRKCLDSRAHLDRLNGKKHLIIGNHDGSVLKDPVCRRCFVEIKDRMEVKDGNRMVVIDHYPLVEWNGFYRGVVHFYGHIHNNVNNATYSIVKQIPNAYNIGADILGFTPRTFDEVIELNKKFFAEH